MFFHRVKRFRDIPPGADRRGEEILRRFLVPLGLLGFVAVFMGAAPVGEFRVERRVIGSGGVEVITADRRVRHTLGQPAIGRSEGTEVIVRRGFWRKKEGTVSGVEGPIPQQPLSFRLDQNHPNPFNPRTTINFSTPREGHVNLSVYDIRGRRVGTLMDETQPAGEHSLVFSPDDLASGVYFYRLKAPGFEQVRRLVLVR